MGMSEFDILLAVVIFAVAGAAKGLVGIGLPTIAISLMSQVFDPRLAITLTIGPLLITNLWQAWRSGYILRTLRRYFPYWATLAVTIYLSAEFAQGISAQAVLFIMGVTVIVFTAAQLAFHPPPLGDRQERPAQVLAGGVSGLMGGITAIWGPPILMFLIARRVPKDEFVRATGVLLSMGAVPLMISYWMSGRFEGARAVLSLALVVPAVLGFALGEAFRAKINGDRFARLVLWMFLLLGLNIIRRAVMGV